MEQGASSCETTTAAAKDERILLLAPTGRDAALAADVLRAEGLTATVKSTMDDLTRALISGAGVLIIAQEALTPPALDSLSRTLSRQPPWSDLPLIVLTGNGNATEAGEMLLASFDRLSNATFLERPLRIATLVRAVHVALRARRRQYEIREHLLEREQAAAERVAMLNQQRTFLRDVLASVTEGKLRLCDTPADLPPRLPALGESLVLTRESLRRLRRETLRLALQAGLTAERADDLVISVNESAMNAVVHGGGGTAVIGGTEPEDKSGIRKTIQIWIEDRGSGIDMAHLPQATLERGYSSAGTFGHGFWLVLKSTDRTYLLTGPDGTTVVIEQDRNPPPPAWMRTEKKPVTA
jgi:anti-sigma regulatory factor (Ser/Thr protein kinase)/FixJ family two-component response regulator